MVPEALRKLLTEVSTGQLAVEEALQKLKQQPFEDLGFARVDLHRGLRRGFPEVVFGQGKTTDQIFAIAESLIAHGGPLLITRLSPEATAELAKRFPAGVVNDAAHSFYWVKEPPVEVGRGVVLVVSAGTSDLPVAEEAALTAWLMGSRVERLFDVGVAGLHRLLHDRAALERAAVLVVVAGMEGALPSVIGGLTDRPIIACPTSVGYGASFNGLAALLGMLNCCAPGVTVVNIDNGFGAGYAAALINRDH